MSGSRGSDYVPRPDMEFCIWARTVSVYSKENHERWGVEAMDEGFDGRLSDLEQKVGKCMEPTRNKVDTLVKNTARKTVEKEVRNYVQGVVARNIKVTDEDREMMGLRLRDVTPTPVGDPEGQATADIAYQGRTQLQLRIKHVEGTPMNSRANYGYRIYFSIYDRDQTLPASGKELRESRFTRQKKELFTFEPEDSSKTVFFCIRYENSRGKTGPWGPMFSAVIP